MRASWRTLFRHKARKSRLSRVSGEMHRTGAVDHLPANPFLNIVLGQGGICQRPNPAKRMFGAEFRAAIRQISESLP